MADKRDYYDVLGVSKTATAEEMNFEEGESLVKNTSLANCLKVNNSCVYYTYSTETEKYTFHETNGNILIDDVSQIVIEQNDSLNLPNLYVVYLTDLKGDTYNFAVENYVDNKILIESPGPDTVYDINKFIYILIFINNFVSVINNRASASSTICNCFRITSGFP